MPVFWRTRSELDLYLKTWLFLFRKQYSSIHQKLPPHPNVVPVAVSRAQGFFQKLLTYFSAIFYFNNTLLQCLVLNIIFYELVKKKYLKIFGFFV